MMYFYSGTPGSGKSLEVAKDIVQKLTIRKQNVIANFDINTDVVYKKGFFGSKRHGTFFSINNQELTVKFLYDYAFKNHKRGVEGQTLLVIDEAQMLFSPTVVKIKCQEDKMYRIDWLKFFTQHRKLGYTIILVSQFDRLIDPQVRCLFEYNVIHRKVNNFKIGWVLSIFHIGLFCSITYWYGVNQKCFSTFFLYHKKYSEIYDSYKQFDEVSTVKKTA